MVENNQIYVRMQGIYKRFPGVQALKNVDLEVRRGESHALVGENGAGKSTLVKILTREYIEDAGKIFLGDHEDQEITRKTYLELQKMGFSLMHQDLNLVPSFTVAQNILLGREPLTKIKTMKWSELRETSSTIIRQVTDRISVTSRVEELSISQRALVAIARAVATKPQLLILDEPTARLDREGVEALFALLNTLKQGGVTIIYISHRLEEIYQMCDQVTVLRDGERTFTGPVKEISQVELVNLIVGRKMEQQIPKEDVPIGEVVFAVKDFKPQERVQEKVNFDLRKAEILGITGSVGAGKTELARAIFGLDKRESGLLFVCGREVSIKGTKNAIDEQIMLVPEDRREEGLVTDFSVRENLSLASLQKYCQLGFWINGKKERTRAKGLVKNLRIHTPGIEQLVRNLSGGNQQKVVISRGLDSDARVFIFDEPTKGIDVGAKAEIYRLIGRLAKEGAGIIYISTELPEILGLCDRVLVMFGGRIMKQLNIMDTTKEEVLFYVMGGEKYGKQTVG